MDIPRTYNPKSGNKPEAPIQYDPAYLRANGWVYQAHSGYWINNRTATACFGWLSATLEQRRRDDKINSLPLHAASL